MLCLTRRIEQKVFLTVPPSSVPTVIEVMPIRTTRKDVKLGITAPKEVAISRDDARPQVVEARYQ